MLTSEQKVILRELSLYTTFLAGALSSLAAPTFCELLLGSMISGEGFLTQALLTIHYENVWSSYHHWVSQGKWRWRDLAHRLILLVSSKVPDGQVISIILDDLTLERCSAKAPACRIHHQHSKKKNRCVYLLGQCWVFLAVAFQRPSDKVHTAIPVMAFPSPKSGNISKIKIAKAMLKSVRQTLQGRILRLLTDSWFMNGPMMQPALRSLVMK